MRGLIVALLLCLVHLSSCQNYEELLNDVCFLKIYVCGDHRWNATESSGHFVTHPYQFEKICRYHKKYIACVDDAISNSCIESMSDLALMTLNNRISLKLFCTDLEWWKSYYSSISCINENKDKIEKVCEYEESTHIEDRPWWCLLPEPCDALQRVFNCTVQKMKGFCRPTAAEVYRRIQMLNADNQDVVCELRRQNPRYCRYERQKRHIKADPKDRVTSPSRLHEQSETEAMNNVVKAVLMDAVKNLEEQRQQGFSRMIDSDNIKLRKLSSVDEQSPNRVKNESQLFKRFGFQEDFKPYPDIAEINHLRRLAENELLQFQKNSKALKYLHIRLKNYLFTLVDMLRHEIIIGSLTEDFVDFYSTTFELPVKNIVCDLIHIAAKNVFKCSIKWYSENEFNARSFSENQEFESVSNDHLSDIHRDGYIFKEELKNNHLTRDYDETDSENHKNPSETSTEPSADSYYSESIKSLTAESNSVSQDLKTNFVEDIMKISQLHEIEDAIDEKLQITDTNNESNAEENLFSIEHSKDGGNNDSVFNDQSDMESKEFDNNLVMETPKKTQLKDMRESTTTTTTEDPFYEIMRNLGYESIRMVPRENEKEIERLTQIRIKLDKEIEREVEKILEKMGASKMKVRLIEKKFKRDAVEETMKTTDEIKSEIKGLIGLVKLFTSSEPIFHEEL